MTCILSLEKIDNIFAKPVKCKNINPNYDTDKNPVKQENVNKI